MAGEDTATLLPSHASTCVLRDGSVDDSGAYSRRWGVCELRSLVSCTGPSSRQELHLHRPIPAAVAPCLVPRRGGAPPAEHRADGVFLADRIAQ